MRARSGGAVAHLVGILGNGEPLEYGFGEVHVWGYPKLLAALPSRPWLHRHSPDCAKQSIGHQLFWERFRLPDEIRAVGCCLLFNVDAGSVCTFGPSVTASRDMLSYEPGEMQRYGLSRARLRLWALKHVQNASLRRANGVIFLTRYAGKIIEGACGRLARVDYIPHGIGEEFRQVIPPKIGSRDEPIRILYVSNVAPYKHQWNVVEAVHRLRGQGYNLRLQLVGGGGGPAWGRLMKVLEVLDPDRKFVEMHPLVEHKKVPAFLAQAHLFLFASSCENMPVTLLEAMAAGLPIACSDRGPMPEVLRDGGIFFDPEKSSSLVTALQKLLISPERRENLATRARQLAGQYSWSRCARETFAFLQETLNSCRL